MKVHYISIQPFMASLNQKIQQGWKELRQEGILHVLHAWECWLRVHRDNPDEIKIMLSRIKTEAGRLTQYDFMGQLAAISEDNKNAAKDAYKLIKRTRQEYWLAWLENFFCEEIIALLPKNPPQDGSNHLFCIALPEFTFMDMEPLLYERVRYCAFYKSVVGKFIGGQLPRTLPGGTQHPLKKFTELSVPQGLNMQIIIFAGTIFGKDESSVYYNMAPVFAGGRCLGIWEKQQISYADFKSARPRHRHKVKYGKNADTPIAEGERYISSVFSAEELQLMQLQQLQPVFRITVFQTPVDFALSICLDYNDPTIIGEAHVDVYVLLSYGMRIEAYIHTVPDTVKLFLYCDGQFKGRACIKAESNEGFWKSIDQSHVHPEWYEKTGGPYFGVMETEVSFGT